MLTTTENQSKTEIPVKIRLQPKQAEFKRAVEKYPVVLYGGAKGGGKSYGIRAILLANLLNKKHPDNIKALLIRRTYDQLQINHVQELYKEHPELMTRYYARGDRVLNLPGNRQLYFRHLQYPADVYNFQGQEFEFIGIDEVTQHPEEIMPVLRTSNRTTKPNVKPKFLMGGNPGGIGHLWVKRLFIDKDYLPNENAADYHFVPAKVYDNPALMQNDPAYVQRLESLPDDKRRAYLEGDWNVFEGQYFAEWRADLEDGTPYHVIKPFPIPDWWKRFISIDWGYFPGWFAAGWYAVAPNKRIYKYKELSLQRNTAREAATKVVEVSGNDPIAYVAADPSCWIKQQGEGAPSIADEFVEGGIPARLLRKANNDRLVGWMMVHKYLSRAPDGLPWMQFFDTCLQTIKTLPSLVHDEVRVEDIDTDSNLDHWADETRYACMTRPFKPAGAVVGGLPGVSEALRKSFEVDEEGKMPNIFEDIIKEELKTQPSYSDEDLIKDYES